MARKLIFFLLVSLGGACAAGSVTISSGPQRVALLELYTSQGCSSCPPADAWLSGLTGHPDLWRRFVPVAFHVDYWDGLGWRDRFGSPDHSARQSAYRQAGHLSGVYTPGFVLAGREWKGWYRKQPLVSTAGPRAGELSARIEGRSVDLAYRPAGAAPAALQAHLVVLGIGLETAVGRGENRGRKLREDFVVLAHAQGPMHIEGEAWRTTLRLPEPGLPASRRAIAAWVSNPMDPAPLQALGGWLP